MSIYIFVLMQRQRQRQRNRGKHEYSRFSVYSDNGVAAVCRLCWDGSRNYQGDVRKGASPGREDWQASVCESCSPLAEMLTV